MDAISHEACRVLKLFGKDCKRVTTTVGPEQEYFLINKEDYAKRRDLILTGRTLFGAPAPKGQELEDHYFGSIRPRVKAFMDDLNEELWKVGVYAKTEHNEVAPAQHEMAPIFETTNIATDHNQLTMELMRKVADRHGFVCLLHEKPFEGINGSGKHNNWSISTDTGENLLDPGKDPASNRQFLLFLTAVIKAVDEYQDLLRISVASAGNDHRLGANEAPPAILSVFVGDELGALLDAIQSGRDYASADTVKMAGASVLPPIPKDTTDRNRTSPFAFTGNKFEFRMLGSAMNIACANIMLNTAVAESLRQFADELEGAEDFASASALLIKREITAHHRILFNGNGYDASWVTEAEKRGLSNLRSTPEALPHYTDDKNVALFERHGVYTRAEMNSRQEIQLEEYAKTISIEALTMVDMIRKDILPACVAYVRELSDTAAAAQAIGVDTATEVSLARTVSAASADLLAHLTGIENALHCVPADADTAGVAAYYHDTVLAAMEVARADADKLETLLPKKLWPFPTYSDLLFYV